jgi:hypothetical protein
MRVQAECEKEEQAWLDCLPDDDEESGEKPYAES